MTTTLNPEESLPLPTLPDEETKEVGRRPVLKTLGLSYAAGTLAYFLNGLSVGIPSISALNARKMPLNTKELDDMKKDFLGPGDLKDIYDQNIAGYVDPIDGQPIITSKGFENLMGLIQVIVRLHYDQLGDEGKKTPYKEYVNDYIKEVCEMCEAMEIDPNVFLMDYAFSGLNVSSNAGQKEDVNVYRAQMVIGAFHEFIGEDKILGIDATKIFQQQFVDEDSYLLSEEGRSLIEILAKAVNPDITLDDTFRKMIAWQAIRLINPTLGSMDLEPITYAEGLEYVLKHSPKAEKYFSQFPGAVNSLKNLMVAKELLELRRSAMKTKANEFVRGYPAAFDDFFDPEKAEEAFRKIGVGKMNFTYSVDTYNGVFFDSSENPKREKLTEEMKQKREDYVVKETAKHFSDLAKKDKKVASEALIADQIFNGNFINYLVGKTNFFATLGIQSSLRDFENAASLFRRFRIRSCDELSKLEYNRKFQLALAIATTKKLNADAKKVYPEIDGNTRSQIQWQGYHGYTREISPFPTLNENFMRPAEDPPYNPIKFLERFRGYYQHYVDEGLILENALPINFEKFAIEELSYIATLRGTNQMDFFGMTDEVVKRIHQKQIEFSGKMFTGWNRMHRLCFLLDITIPDNYFGRSNY